VLFIVVGCLTSNIAFAFDADLEYWLDLGMFNVILYYTRMGPVCKNLVES